MNGTIEMLREQLRSATTENEVLKKQLNNAENYANTLVDHIEYGCLPKDIELLREANTVQRLVCFRDVVISLDSIIYTKKL